MAEAEPDAARRAELAEIARICAKVPFEPAGTLHEAAPVHLAPPGGAPDRVERAFPVLRPARPVPDRFLRARPRRGTDHRGAGLRALREPLDQVRHHQQDQELAPEPATTPATPSTRTSPSAARPPDGRDAVNPLSFLILKSVARMRLTQPNLTVRYHRGLADAFLRECVEVIRCGFGMPAFNSDEIIIPSLLGPRREAGGRLRLQRHRLRRGRRPGQVGLPGHRDELHQLPPARCSWR